MYKESQQKIGVFLIEENQIDRQGAYSMISKQQGMEVLGQASSVEEVLFENVLRELLHHARL